MIQDTPSWLTAFMTQVGRAYERLEQRVEWWWKWVEGTIEVVICPKLVEIEGAWCLESDIRVDVFQIIALFDSCDDVTFSLVCDGADCLHISGNVGRNDMWLQLLNNLPEDANMKGMRLGGSFEDTAKSDDLVADDLVSNAAAHARETGSVYETAKELARMWREERTATFELLNRLERLFAEEAPHRDRA